MPPTRWLKFTRMKPSVGGEPWWQEEAQGGHGTAGQGTKRCSPQGNQPKLVSSYHTAERHRSRGKHSTNTDAKCSRGSSPHGYQVPATQVPSNDAAHATD